MKKHLKINSLILSVCILAVLPLEKLSAAASANLNQGRNGTDLLPTNPVNWSNGNLGGSQAHYIEGMSSPYQCIMTGLTPGTQVLITIGYDVKNSGQQAFDYLTYYYRMMPHAFALHSTAETTDPLAGSTLGAATPFTTYTIPMPSSTGSPVAGQPGISYNKLSAAERKMILYNGTIDSIYYFVQGDLTQTQSETQIIVKFTPSNATAVLAWGAHIASRNDWGYSGGSPRSAGGISGSPFHMRLISWSLGSLGSQDRGLAGGSVFPPPAPLPIELIQFSARAEGNSNVIDWTTASEINNESFTLERSAGVTKFESLAIINGAGNSTSARNYSWTDKNPLPGTSYYRLIQTDFDGTQKIYGPISCQRSKLSEFVPILKVFSNISSDGFYISYSAPAKGDVMLEILNAEGREIRTERLNAGEGANFMKVSNDKIGAQGIYFVRIVQGDVASQVQKIVVN